MRASVPINRLAPYVGVVIRAIRASFPMLGTTRIGQILARSGLHVGEMTVRRLAKEKPRTVPPSGPEEQHGGTNKGAAAASSDAGPSSAKPASARRVTAKYAHHVWHTDLTFVPTWAGLFVPWLPFSLPQCWPFGWWVGGVLDHHSRILVKARVWKTLPSAARVVGMLRAAVAAAGRPPKHIVSDRGAQFRTEYVDWCESQGVRPRFGAVHQHGSIAMIERFWLSMKDECFRRMPVPLDARAMRAELAAYLLWYHTARPHQALGGLTPAERLSGGRPAREQRRLETRPNMPVEREGPGRLKLRRVKGTLQLCVVRQLGAAKLPVFELRQAA